MNKFTATGQMFGQLRLPAVSNIAAAGNECSSECLQSAFQGFDRPDFKSGFIDSSGCPAEHPEQRNLTKMLENEAYVGTSYKTHQRGNKLSNDIWVVGSTYDQRGK